MANSFGNSFQLQNTRGARVVSITEYPQVGHLKDTGKEYVDLGLGELNGFHRLGLGVNPGIVKTMSIDTSGYDFYKVMQHLGPSYQRMEGFNQGPNMLPTMGLPTTGLEGFSNVDRGYNFYGFGDPYGLNAPHQHGEQTSFLGPMAMNGQLQLMAPGNAVIARR